MKQQWFNQLSLPHITRIQPVSGGDVNQAYHLVTEAGDYFLLTQPRVTKEFYAGEIAGLKAFQEAGITAPRVIANGEIDHIAYLILSYLEEGTGQNQYALGQLVAKLHQATSPTGQFGFDYSYQGTAIQFPNQWRDSWIQLFVNERMDTLSQVLLKQGLWQDVDNERYQEVRAIIVDVLNHHPSQPSLLHGDLWFGNVMFLTDGQPALFDPSPLYGDREFDLGVTRTFGGFSGDFYCGYEDTLPTAKGSRYRQEFYRLYLLMIHLLKFGPTYAMSVDHAMEQILARPHE